MQRADAISNRDAISLFVSYLEWQNRGCLDAYRDLIDALEDVDADVREVAGKLLTRASRRAGQLILSLISISAACVCRPTLAFISEKVNDSFIEERLVDHTADLKLAS